MLIENVVTLIKCEQILVRLWFFLDFFRLYLSTVQLNLNFFSEYRLVFLHDWRPVIDMTISICNDTTFSEVFESSGIGAFLHEEELFVVPFIQVGWFDKWVNNSILPVFSSTVDTQMHSQMNGCPFWVFLLTIDADLHYHWCTLLSFWCLIAAKVWSRTESSTNYENEWIRTYYPFLVIFYLLRLNSQSFCLFKITFRKNWLLYFTFTYIMCCFILHAFHLIIFIFISFLNFLLMLSFSFKFTAFFLFVFLFLGIKFLIFIKIKDFWWKIVPFYGFE